MHVPDGERPLVGSHGNGSLPLGWIPRCQGRITRDPRVERTLLCRRATCRVDGQPCTGPGVFTCAHLAAVNPQMRRWDYSFRVPSPSTRASSLDGWISERGTRLFFQESFFRRSVSIGLVTTRFDEFNFKNIPTLQLRFVTLLILR